MGKSKLQRRIWITWERQRRSIELAKALDSELFLFNYNGWLRYPKSILNTMWIMIKKKPTILFVQNPSMILAAIACLFGLVSKTFIVVDRHTTFWLSRKYRITPKYILLKVLHRFTIKFADLTIVTNKYLANIVRDLGGKSFVLQDKLPVLYKSKEIKLKGTNNLLMISSFGLDEPIEEVLKAMIYFERKDVFLYITGNYQNLDKNLYLSSPHNVIFTGYLPENDFMDLIFSVDAVIVLTTSEYVMLCGCYEAVSAEKPFITSNKIVLKEYFKGTIFTENSATEIAKSIDKIFKDIPKYQKRIKELKMNIIPSWNKLIKELNDLLEIN